MKEPICIHVGKARKPSLWYNDGKCCCRAGIPKRSFAFLKIFSILPEDKMVTEGDEPIHNSNPDPKDEKVCMYVCIRNSFNSWEIMIAKTGRPARTYIQQLCEDTRCSFEDLLEAMNDREKWQERVWDICASGMTWWWWFCNLNSLLPLSLLWVCTLTCGYYFIVGIRWNWLLAAPPNNLVIF